MSILLFVLVGVVVGVVTGGWRAISLARRDEFRRANRWLLFGGGVAAITAFALTTIILEWPFAEETSPHVEEIETEVTEIVEVPVTVWRWYVWPVTETEERPRVVTKTAQKSVMVTTHRFDFVRLMLLGLVSAAACLGTIWIVRPLWWLFG